VLALKLYQEEQEQQADDEIIVPLARRLTAFALGLGPVVEVVLERLHDIPFRSFVQVMQG